MRKAKRVELRGVSVYRKISQMVFEQTRKRKEAGTTRIVYMSTEVCRRVTYDLITWCKRREKNEWNPESEARIVRRLASRGEKGRV